MKIYFINYSMMKKKFLHYFLFVHVIRVNDVSSIVKVARGIFKEKGKVWEIIALICSQFMKFFGSFFGTRKKGKNFFESCDLLDYEMRFVDKVLCLLLEQIENEYSKWKTFMMAWLGNLQIMARRKFETW